MNNIQKETMDLAVARYNVDSTPGLPLCCEEHKQLGFLMIQLTFLDVTDDKRYGEDTRDLQCLN